ncbi:PEP-CTERM sorting domain-containing protein [Aliterella atlantica]|uniref:Ice-binding protein C-terminal domain-containing protein n=1 Tax=Aliterella atlantica CENA595 TaxID=1618023 RepID=A0A0D8ZYA6_9CYAN|nr:PEP-CTERM sorting domain-containing protein [Aliterella atlantica]KJH72181.1 hypothetical protein UH38_08950 [Aliterella atlantica CENA595]
MDLRATALLAGLGVALTISQATPSTAQTFSGNSSGTFGTPNAGSYSNPVFSGVGTNTFNWGSPAGTPANELSFTGNSFSGELDSLFAVGDLTYFNGTVSSDTLVDSVPLDIALDFGQPDKASQVFRFDFSLFSTLNTGTDEENADFVTPINSFGDRSISFGGTEYTLQLTGFSQDGGNTIVDRFNVLENESTTAAIYGKITTKPVPEPSSVLGILALGALGGGSMLKRKQQKKAVKI